MAKIDYKMSKPFKMTRKGTQPNKREERLVTVSNGAIVARVRKNAADELVKGGQWDYCPKSEYKNAE